MYQGPSGTQWLQLYRAATAVENCSSIYHYIMYMPRIYLYVFITLSKFKWCLMAVLVNRFHKTVNKVFKSAVVIFQVILLDQLNMLTSLVRAVDSRLESPGLQPCGITVLCSEAKHFTLTMLLSTQEFFDHISLNYPAGKPDEMLGSYLVTSWWTDIPSMGE